MINALVDPVKDRISAAIRSTARTAAWGGVAGAALVMAFLFGVGAAFIWLSHRYDTMAACGVMAGAFLILAAVGFLGVHFSSRSAAKPAVSPARPGLSMLINPAILGLGLRLTQKIGVKRVLPLAIIGVAGLAWFAARAAQEPGSPPNETA